MVANPKLLEMCRDLQVLELSHSSRFANIIWHMRDSYILKLHPSVPMATREVLKWSPRHSSCLFVDETVAIAAANIKRDIRLQTNWKVLQNLQTPGPSQRKGKKPPGQQPV
jgi:hypothetical protein